MMTVVVRTALDGDALEASPCSVWRFVCEYSEMTWSSLLAFAQSAVAGVDLHPD